MTSPAKYNSDNIETLAFPMSVRQNASQYIGGLDEQGIWNCARELLDNAADEAMAGRNNAALLYCDTDGSFWVQDSGPGIPQGTKKQKVIVSGKEVISTMPTMQAVFGALHTSGKYRDDAYKTSIGTHGIGAKGTNATASFFEVWTCFENQWSTIRFEKGVLKKQVRTCKPPKGPTGIVRKGTLIHFKPDPTIFTVKKFPVAFAVEWARMASYMNPGFKVVLASPKGKKEFLSKLGTLDYIKDRQAELKVEIETDLFEYKSSLLDVILAFSSYDGCDLRGFTNGLSNAAGGHHCDVVSKALFEAIQPFKAKKQEFSRREFDDGLMGLVNAKLHKANFSSQDKAKLTDVRVSAESELLLKAATAFFKSNKALTARLCEKATKLTELKTKFKASKAVVSSLNAFKRTGLPPNYAPPARAIKIADRELFVVEGDSAAGGFRKVRARHQGLLPLSGKIMNLAKRSTAAKGGDGPKAGRKDPLQSKAILSIMAAIGFDPKAVDAIKKLQVGRIICLADADADGGHINSLLLAFFYKLMPEVFDAGIVYVADMPEFMAIAKGQLFTGSSHSEVQAKLDHAKVKASIKHIKGWGEVDPPILKILAVNNTRKLLKVKPISTEDEVTFEKIMANDVEARREVLGISEENHHD